MPKCTSARCNSRSAIPGSPFSDAGRATDHTCRQAASLATGDYADGRLRCQLTTPVLWGLSTTSGGCRLGKARMLASVSEMLWKVTPKVLAQTALSLPAVGAHPAPSPSWY